MDTTHGRQPQEALPLSSLFLYILICLFGGERHGYSMLAEIRARLQGMSTLGPTSLYRNIDRMLESQLIIESDNRPDKELDDSRRTYYQITDFGKKVLVEEGRRLESIVKELYAIGILENTDESSVDTDEERKIHDSQNDNIGSLSILQNKDNIQEQCHVDNKLEQKSSREPPRKPT